LKKLTIFLAKIPGAAMSSAARRPYNYPVMTNCGLAAIDDLLHDPIRPAIDANQTDLEAVGILQGLLSGHGFNTLPGPFDESYGRFGPHTIDAVRTFQTVQSLPVSGAVDRATLLALIGTPATTPLATRGYLALCLDIPPGFLTKSLTLTTAVEGGGRFAALNANRDRAGLSFGLIQWAQRPGRLAELLRAMQTADRDRFVRTVAAGDPVLADRLIAHCARGAKALAASGASLDPTLELTAEPWVGRFHALGLDPVFQRAQTALALEAFSASMRAFAPLAPTVSSERGFAFLLDVANQHGNAGLADILTTVRTRLAPVGEAALLRAVQDESVARVTRQFGPGNPNTVATLRRRVSFRTTRLLSDLPLGPLAHL
jgi:peptidoglycan hydrolase-like protein with peptidoglycan-binding domain